MSVVIACKFNNGVILASDRQVTRGFEKIENKVTKVHKVEGKNMAIGTVGRLRDLQMMNVASSKLFSNIDELDEESCIKIMNSLTRVYREFEFIEPGKIVTDIDSLFLFVDPYNINFIGSDLGVLSGFDYYAIGCGDNLVIGNLNIKFKNINPEELTFKEVSEILKDSIKISCKDSLGIDDNVDILVLYKHACNLVEDDEFEIISKCEYKVIDKSKPKKECNHKCEECPHYIKFIYSRREKTIKMISSI